MTAGGHYPLPAMIRRLSLLLALVVLAPACAYESSGTTTTTVALVDDLPAPTGPADLVAVDQKSEGSSVVVESVSLPAAGWVVVRADDGGSPGEVIGISTLLQKGVIAGVSVPFLVPLAESSPVHLALHIDVDEDGSFQYEPPDGFIDEIGVRATGEPAVATITVSLLPPLQPGDAFLDSQVTDGTTVTVAGGLLPAPGFLVLQQDEGGFPGAVLAVSDLRPAGVVDELVLAPLPALRASGSVFVVAWVDRDEDGVFSPGEDGDAQAVRSDGSLAAGSALITVIPRDPASLSVSDQESDGDTFTVEEVVMPNAGFLEILSDAGGAPGTRLGFVEVGASTTDDLAVPIPAGVATGARLWLRLWVDFDQDDTLSADDLPALGAAGGDPVTGSFVLTIVTP